MDGMGCLVLVSHKDRGERLEQQALRVLLALGASGGVVYTRWGKTSCPTVSGTELVYAGRAGGTWFQSKGGAANYLCMPDDPDYFRYSPGVQGYSYVYGAEYQSHHGPLSAKTRCPSTWTLEYSGYLMSEARTSSDHHRTMYKCVDKNPDSIPGSISDINGALFYHVEANCNGMACPP